MNKIRCVEKVKKHKDKLVIFYSPWCPYSKDAVSLARQSGLGYRNYDVDNVPGGFKSILDIFVTRKNEVGFNANYKTRPLVFYKGNFIGGFNELSLMLFV
jgi:glutaredoxin